MELVVKNPKFLCFHLIVLWLIREKIMKENSKNYTHLNLLVKIEKREAEVRIIGLGYVGLPLEIHFGQQGSM